MTYKGFILFLSLASCGAMHTHAQSAAELVSKQKDALSKIKLDVQGHINSAKKVLRDSVLVTQDSTVFTRDSIESSPAKGSESGKSVSLNPKVELKDFSSQTKKDIKQNVNTTKGAVKEGVSTLRNPIDPNAQKQKVTTQLNQLSAMESSELKSQSSTVKSQSAEITDGILSKVTDAKHIANDSVPVWKRIKTPNVDSVGVSYENGKLVLPDNMKDIRKLGDKLPDMANEKVNEESHPGGVFPSDLPKAKEAQQLIDKASDINAENLKSTVVNGSEGLLQKNESYQTIKHHTDSVKQLIEKGQDIVNDINGGLDLNHIYSSKTLKRLYDSLGISKLDSVMALAASQEEVSKEELLQKINASFPSSSIDQKMTGLPNVSKPSDLTSLKENIPSSDLPNTSELTSLKNKVSDVNIPNTSDLSAMKDKVPTNLSDMKLSVDELKELAPLRGFQLPTDSIPVLDSLRKQDVSREKIQMNQSEAEELVKSAIVQHKPAFWDNAYFEGIVSFLKNTDFNSFQLSPALGYQIKNNLSLGIGPNVLVQQQHSDWNVNMGFRSFVKYQLFDQRFYLQVEDMVDPATVNQEYISKTRHSILTGAGALLPITRTLAINFCVLYRANNDAYSSGERSPWVVRLGLSTKKSKNKEHLK